MNWTPVRALGGMMQVLQPGLVHHATSWPSVSVMVESGLGGAQRQKSSGRSEEGVSQSVSNRNGDGDGMENWGAHH